MFDWLSNWWNNPPSIYDHLPDDFDEDAVFEANVSDITGGDSLKDIVVDKSQQLYYLAILIGGEYLYKTFK